jgi:hypothetical protein
MYIKSFNYTADDVLAMAEAHLKLFEKRSMDRRDKTLTRSNLSGTTLVERKAPKVP